MSNELNSTDSRQSGRPVVPTKGRLRPLGIGEVRLSGGFWGQKQQTNAKESIVHCEKWIEKVGWIGNFDAAVEGRLPRDRRGREFSDSDVYKLIEAMAWEVGRSGDKDMDRRLIALVERIAAAQEKDGYLNTRFGRPGQEPRYSNLPWGHELYCYGHLLQAAVARGRTRGNDLLVTVARRAADHVCDVFGVNGLQGVCGHPEVETALVEFSRYTGDPRYQAQAKLFIDRRGRGILGEIEFGREYFQDDQPVRETRVMSGHAVRALYLASGAADLAVELQDEELLSAVIQQTKNTIARRTYITGGMGSRHEGEAFGLDYELPPDRAYSETCAGVGSVMLNYRLLLATGDAQYGDNIERTLFNVVAASPSQDGKAFFYTNTLHQRQPGSAPSKTEASPRAASSLRAPWFEVSCCPTNVARTLASLAAYVATSNERGIQIHLYAGAVIETILSDGSPVRIQVKTDYPNDGLIRIEIEETGALEWTLSLRVPGWSTKGATALVGGESRTLSPGMTDISRVFQRGDVVELHLPVEPRWVFPDPRVDSIRGCVAVEQGPLVLCLESNDLPGVSTVDAVRVRADGSPLVRDGKTSVRLRKVDFPENSWPYSKDPVVRTSQEYGEAVLIPYHAWANRGPSTMRVWLPSDEKA